MRLMEYPTRVRVQLEVVPAAGHNLHPEGVAMLLQAGHQRPVSLGVPGVDNGP